MKIVCRLSRVVVCASVSVLAMSFIASAHGDVVVEVEGKTATVANGFTGTHPAGSHFHSTTDPHVLPPSNPSITLPSMAEVGGFFGDEELQGISEFELQDDAVIAAVLLFDVRDMTTDDYSPWPIDGLFGQGPFEGIVDVHAYDADHVEDVSDFLAEHDRTSDPPLLAIPVGPGLIDAGDTLSTDITTLYNSLVADDEHALGIRLITRDVDKDAGAITFHNFRLQLTVSDPAAVPEPSPVLLLGVAGLALSGLARYRRVRPA